MLTLLPTAEQLQLADAVSSHLAANMPVSRLLPKSPRRLSRDRGDWRSLVDLGLFGLAAPDELGGSGLGTVEEALINREVGRYLLTSAVLASQLGCRLAAQAGKNDLAAAIVAGERRVVLGIDLDTCEIGETCSGEIQIIDGALGDLVILWNGTGAALVEYDAVVREEVQPQDDTIGLENGRVDGLATVFLSTAQYDLGRQASTLIAAQLAGIADAVMQRTVEHAVTRRQFGQPLGAFQAIKHKCADMKVRAEVAWAQTLYAAQAIEAGQPGAFEASAAKQIAADYAILTAEDSVQVHGAIAYTAELDIHLFLKRAHLLAVASGDRLRENRVFLGLRRP